MGKAEDEQPLPISVVSGGAQQNVEARWVSQCFGLSKCVGLRCIMVLMFSAALFLSALFWLPPFLHFRDQKSLNPDLKYKDHDIVASFFLKEPVSLVEDNSLQLADDIFDEIGEPSTKVVILSLEYCPEVNNTKVVFAFDPDGEYTDIFLAAESLIRESFESIVINQTSLRLTKSLFGDPSYFEVIKFRGGITVAPMQSVFLLQKGQALFNFTLNFSIDQLQDNFEDLKNQLKSGLHLASYENLYVKLSNSNGSTVSAPTTVQSSVLLTVGNTPSTQRLKELAQTISDSHSRNLGLNNTVFGKVKQVRLSSILQHSLHGHNGSDTGWSPSPSPLPNPAQDEHHHHHNHHHPHHHRHHHYHHGNGAHLGPVVSPSPAPAIQRSASPPKSSTMKNAPAPLPNHRGKSQNSQFGNARRKPHGAPRDAPSIAPSHPAGPPHQKVDAPSVTPHFVPASSPLPHVVFAHADPPSSNEPASPNSGSHFTEPSPSPSFAGHLSTRWAMWLVLCLVLCLVMQW